MLQQTRAPAVIPYYYRFLGRYPDLRKLARSRESGLLRAWSGLGYYRRARNLRRAARQVAAAGGRLPTTYQEWVRLPGVGPYTAAAVTSIAFGAPVASLDGNAARVMARLTAERGELGSTAVREGLRRDAQALLDRRHPGEFNQALMDLGATVCVAREPRCQICPVEKWCQARRLGIQGELPVRRPARAPLRLEMAVAVVSRGSAILLRRREGNAPLLAGFWELPQVEGPKLGRGCFARLGLRRGERLGEFRHAITYHDYRATVFRAGMQGRPRQGWRWIPLAELPGLPLTTVSRKALREAGKKL